LNWSNASYRARFVSRDWRRLVAGVAAAPFPFAFARFAALFVALCAALVFFFFFFFFSPLSWCRHAAVKWDRSSKWRVQNRDRSCSTRISPMADADTSFQSSALATKMVLVYVPKTPLVVPNTGPSTPIAPVPMTSSST
jgi:hypothetical protein